MTTTVDMGKMKSFDKSDMNGIKPFGTIGPDQDSMTASKRILNKLKKKKVAGNVAEGSTTESGEQANVTSGAINTFVNRGKTTK